MTATAVTAREWLDTLISNVGPTSDRAPWVLAAVDQHAAAVRDIIELGVPRANATAGSVLLAGYAQGLLAGPTPEAAEARPPAPPELPTDADEWLVQRLHAVCALAARPGGWRADPISD